MSPEDHSGGYLSLTEVAERRGLHYMTIYRHVRTGKLPAIKVNGEWRVREKDLFAKVPPTQSRPGHADVGSRIAPLIDRLTAGDEAGAWSIIEGCLSAGSDPIDMLHLLLVPAMGRIGDLWSEGSMEIVSEHTATTVAHRLVARLGPMMRSKGRSRGSIVMGAVAGDPHSLSVAILADVLRHARYSVIDLGGNTPAESFVEMVRTIDQCRAVGISASVPADDAVRSTVDQIRAINRTIPILVGGRGVNDEDHAKSLGSCVYVVDSQLVAATFEKCIANSERATDGNASG